MCRLSDPHTTCLLGALLCGLFAIGTPASKVAAQTSSVSVDPSTVTNGTPRKLLGTSFDGRTGLQVPGPNQTSIPVGYYDANNQILPAVAPLWNQIELTTLRYPGNLVDQCDWRETVGPMAGRSPQPYNGTTQTQVINFGFDDFMSMVATHNAAGVPAPEVQIMVSTQTSLTVTTQAEVIQMAADWVEYANSPADGSNPGGGIDWAAQRSANGHPAPYDIRIWNIGNEPWGPMEPYNFNVPGNAAAFANLAQQFITAMKAMDPTIQITIPSAAHPLPNAVDNAAQANWDNTMLSQLGGQIYGLVEHIFYGETAVRGITSSAASIDQVLARIANSAHPEVKLLLGDHAHDIVNNPTPAQADYGMQWQAAVTNADFLVMLAGKPIDLANFWIYGLPADTWHPIRKNANNTYTLMAAGSLYAKLASAVRDEAVSVDTVSPPTLDGSANYSLRAGAFRESDQSRLTLVVVNRDSAAAQSFDVQGLDSYQVASARRFTATGPTADTFDVTDVPVLPPSGIHDMPASSILIVEFDATVVATPDVAQSTRLALAAPRPNPARAAVSFEVDFPSIGAARADVLDVAGRLVRTLHLPTGPGPATLAWNLRDTAGHKVASGVYFVRLRSIRDEHTRQVVVVP